MQTMTQAETAAFAPDPLPDDGAALGLARRAMQNAGCATGRQQMGSRWPIGCVALEITQRCNLDCTLCYLSEHSEAVKDIPLGEIYRRSDLIGQHYGPGTDVQITGGEPTLRRRDELVAIVRRVRGFRTALGCRLCWRIALAVFGLILFVESLILIPSAMRFEQTELGRLDHVAATAVESVLMLYPQRDGIEAIRLGFGRVVGAMGVLGLAALAPDGTPMVQAGEAIEGLATAASHAQTNGLATVSLDRSPDGGRYEIAWRMRVQDRDLVMAARLDSSHLSEQLRAYVWRIAGLVALIVLVVTAGTMLVLHFSLLAPIMRLRASMLRAGAEPERAGDFAVRTRRTDELGEVIGAHNSMLARVADSIRRDRSNAEERARYVSHHDPLTGMPNRRAFGEHVQCQADEGAASACDATVFVVNIVRLRQVNAGLDHQAGDQLLKDVGVRLQRAAGPGEFVAHLGAGRFAVAVFGLQSAEAGAEFAERLLRDAQDAYVVAGHPLTVALRIGITHAPVAVTAAEELLSQAELALEKIVPGGAGRYAFFSTEMSREAQARQSIATDLNGAIARGELTVAYQPKIAISGDAPPALMGAEALVRWTHARRGPVRPDVFVPIAEATGLILPLGEFVLREVCRQVSDWRARLGWSPRLAVNVSAHQFAEPSLVGLVERVLLETGAPASSIELEVTESAAMRDVERTARTLHALREIGVHVSIDDFGTGYSSLSYLRRLPIDAIKVDKSFVDDIGKDVNADAICSAIIDMARALGKRVIAEGVETHEQLAFLGARGCDEIQGYLFGRPEAAAKFEALHLGKSGGAANAGKIDRIERQITIEGDRERRPISDPGRPISRYPD